MAEHIWQQEAACGSCSATGLYVGVAERDGGAVVCHSCNGSGKTTLKIVWNDFTGRVPRNDVRRVYEVNPGITIGEGDGFLLSDFGGIPYQTWESGGVFGPGTEDRAYTCPAWWYQCADYSKKPHWDKCIGIGSFSACKHFAERGACWVRFDAEESAK